MKKRSILLVIPLILLPYLALFTIATVFLSTELDFFRYIMESIFDSNGLYIILAFILYCIFTVILTAFCFEFNISKKYEPLSFAKTVMIIKIIQIPAYLTIFVLGVLLAITIITLPFAIGLFWLDCLSLALSGALLISVAINSIKQGIFKLNDVLWIMILQFVFCADVISSIIFYIKLKKAAEAKRQSAQN